MRSTMCSKMKMRQIVTKTCLVNSLILTMNRVMMVMKLCYRILTKVSRMHNSASKGFFDETISKRSPLEKAVYSKNGKIMATNKFRNFMRVYDSKDSHDIIL
ncbi:unnamed protein product [Acanthoscelides obtectus]|uniref:Uncharacterized protein n=1 Tax=Acanthoscelides obtectus TaxID=200917 RepID=A0A9P0LCC1_ACAOB|nr:unnamed protein product [Acanthoscelides obtectus]CAK1637559.1 hypothetical protein AOBTE_LOCUS10049 [Acanthoscelides obtectus]